ncbi:MAG: cation transporter [Kiloniellales bacterium]|nr:cation transporter [Kiloniellales bacterium]
MQTSTLEQERRYLKISVLGNVVVGCVGIAAAAVSASQAILLDGLFNLTYFATGLFTVKVASMVAGGDDERFPHGYAFFEPLMNGIKGMLVLGVSVMALAGAVKALLTGGSSIAAGIAVAYGVFASLVCWGVALTLLRGGKVTGSPLVSADAENWVVNAAISSCVLIAFVGIFVLNALGAENLALYVDPTVVLIVVAISIFVPVRMAWNAFMELMNRAPSDDIVKQVTGIVDTSLADLPVQERFIRVIQPGRSRMVLIHVVLPTDYEPSRLTFFDAIRTEMYQALRKAHMATVLDLVFTADRQWGAPISDGGFGGPQT